MYRKNKHITCIVIGVYEHKLIQYADDTIIIIDGTEKSFKKSLD